MFGSSTHFLLSLIFLALRQTTVMSLRVDPMSISEPEGDAEVHFFCLENDGTSQATGISWRDPRGTVYTPGNPTEGGNPRIVAEGFRLSVFDLVREDSGGYECFRGSSESVNATLLVYASPEILNPMPIQEIYFGMTSLLVCQVDRGNPPADVTWLHVTYDEEDEQVIEVITESWNERFTAVENGLEIADVRSTDEGLYRCYVQNSHGIEALDIQAAFREAPQFVKEDREVQLSFILGVGESATLDCSSAGAPSPNISWSFPPNSQLGQGPPPTSLILDVQLADGVDAGEYGCVVQNEAGSITRTFTVKLAIAPEPAVKYRNVTMELGKELSLECSVSSLPEPQFQWFVDTTPLPRSSWTSIYDDIMGNSTLVYTFGGEELDEDCKVDVVCVATNSYGRSEHHYLLTPSNLDDCRRTGATPTSSSPDITVANDQGRLGEGLARGNSEDEMGGTTFKVIIGSFTVAATVIVIGVVILLVYFLKHFCAKKKAANQLTSANPSVCQHSISNLHLSGDHGSISMTSSLPREEISTMDGIAKNNLRLDSVDSGVSDSGVSVCSVTLQSGSSSTGHREFTPLPPTPREGVREGVYHHLDHKLPSVSSFGSSSSSTQLLGTSSATHSSIVLSTQMSTGYLEDSTASSTASSVFVSCEPPPQPQRNKRFWQSQHHGTDHTTPAVVGGGCLKEGVDGMMSNPSYETHRLKITATGNDEPPHIYEAVY